MDLCEFELSLVYRVSSRIEHTPLLSKNKVQIPPNTHMIWSVTATPKFLVLTSVSGFVIAVKRHQGNFFFETKFLYAFLEPVLELTL